MSMKDAEAFLARSETDRSFASGFEALEGDQEAIRSRMQELGYDAEPDELVAALSERYGIELSPDQLEAVAAGNDDAGLIGGAIVGGALGTGAVVAVCAAFAVAAAA
jgi:predicted ribosomally synthesized peptide with nif11-like leader